jgi:hypothetical protein
MLRSFTVKNFRCLEDFEIRNLARVNLIVGDNNSGKSALLEALFVHRLQTRIIGLLDLKSFRNDHPVTNGAYWLDLFTSMDDSREIVLTSTDEHGNKAISKLATRPNEQEGRAVGARNGIGHAFSRSAPGEIPPALRVEYTGYQSTSGKPHENILTFDRAGAKFITPGQSPPDAPTIVFSASALPDSREISMDISPILVRKQKAALLRVARAIDGRVSDITIASPNGVPEVFLDTSGSQLQPLTSMGSGMVRAIAFAAAIPSHETGLALIDEIENGIHHRRLAELWAGLYALAEECNVQIVASTHSQECVDAAIAAIMPGKNHSDALHVYRIERGRRIPVPYEGEVLQSVPEFHAEVR